MLLHFREEFLDLFGGVEDALRFSFQMRLHTDDLKMVFHLMYQMIDYFAGVFGRFFFLGRKNSSAHAFLRKLKFRMIASGLASAVQAGCPSKIFPLMAV
jgi:hypothetical protein